MYTEVTDKMKLKSGTITVADWIKKLRSGRFAQGEGQLCAGLEFCCLGVAARTFGVELKSYGPRDKAKGLFTQDLVDRDGVAVSYFLGDVLGDDFENSLGDAIRRNTKPITISFPCDDGYTDENIFTLADGRISQYVLETPPEDDPEQLHQVFHASWTRKDIQGFFTHLNDDVGLNFKQIADLLEAFFRPLAKLHLGWYTGRIEAI